MEKKTTIGPDGRLGTPINRNDVPAGARGWGRPAETPEEIAAAEEAQKALGPMSARQPIITEYFIDPKTGQLIGLQGWARMVLGIPLFQPVGAIMPIKTFALLMGIRLSTAYFLSRKGRIVGKLPPVTVDGVVNPRQRVRIVRDAFLLNFARQLATLRRVEAEEAEQLRLAEIG